jgi:hypothetical protein
MTMQQGQGPHHHRHHQQGQQAPQGYAPPGYQGYPPQQSGGSGVTTVLVVIGAIALVGILCVVVGVMVFAMSGGGKTRINNRHVMLHDGEGQPYSIKKGTYRIHITATGDGVDVNSIGGNGCKVGSNEHNFDDTCTFPADGQLDITNVHLLGSSDSSVDVEVTPVD